MYRNKRYWHITINHYEYATLWIYISAFYNHFDCLNDAVSVFAHVVLCNVMYTELCCWQLLQIFYGLNHFEMWLLLVLMCWFHVTFIAKDQHVCSFLVLTWMQWPINMCRNIPIMAVIGSVFTFWIFKLACVSLIIILI